MENQNTETKWFTRYGIEHTGTISNINLKTGTASYQYLDKCGRCSGQGGSDAWKFTGWTCYKCGGAGNFGYKTGKVYTQEKLDKLNAAQLERDLKKQKINEEIQLKKTEELNLLKNQFETEHPNFIKQLSEVAHKNIFICNLVAKFNIFGYLTQNQIDAALKTLQTIEAEDQKKNEWIGKEKERIEGLELFVKNISSTEGYFGGTTLIINFEDKEGRSFVWFCSGNLNQELNKGTPLKLTGTVKAHNDYRGRKQTVLTRCKFEVVAQN